jgi:two-component system, NarL family, response regulator LiaR
MTEHDGPKLVARHRLDQAGNHGQEGSPLARPDTGERRRVDGQDHPHIMSKGQRYLLVVVDHDSGRLVWAGKNRTRSCAGREPSRVNPHQLVQSHVGVSYMRMRTSACRSGTVCAVPSLRVLLVDDQQMLAEAIAEGLASNSDLWVLGRRATDDPRWTDAVARLRPEVVVLYSAGRAKEVGHLIMQITAASPDAAVVLLAPAPDAPMAVAAARAGAMAILDMDATMERLARLVVAVRNGDAYYPDELLGTVLQVLRGDAKRMRAADAKLRTLSARECEVLREMMVGKSGKQIARQMALSPNTVKTYSRSILMKLDVHSKLDAVAVAWAAGWQFERLPTPSPALTCQAPHHTVRDLSPEARRRASETR